VKLESHTMTAQPAPTGYRSFPPEYFTILDRVERLTPSGDFRIGPFARKDAMAGRRSFYRFRNALNEEAATGDAYANRYKDIANLLKLELLEVPPLRLANGPPLTAAAGQWQIVFALNPIVAAIRRLEEPTP
jgi:hypothetical protein